MYGYSPPVDAGSCQKDEPEYKSYTIAQELDTTLLILPWPFINDH